LEFIVKSVKIDYTNRDTRKTKLAST